MSQWAHYSTPDPELLEMIKDMPVPPPGPGPTDFLAQRKIFEETIKQRNENLSCPGA